MQSGHGLQSQYWNENDSEAKAVVVVVNVNVPPIFCGHPHLSVLDIIKFKVAVAPSGKFI